MRSHLTAALLALGSLLAAGQASAAPQKSEPRQCFYTRDVRSWAPQGESRVNIRVGVRDVYALDLIGYCPNIDWNMGVALVSRGSTWICSGLEAEIITRGPSGRERCPVTHIRKLTPDEVKALPPRAQP